MREIEFRAWTGERFVGEDDFYIRYGKVYTITEFDDVVDKKWIPQQYTGLRDNDGRKIYEGDIVNYFHYGMDEIGEITYIVNAFKVVIPKIGGVYNLSEKSCLILGNIFENPELLK